MHRFSVRSGERAGVIERYLVYCLHSRHPTSFGTTSIISFRGIPRHQSERVRVLLSTRKAATAYDGCRKEKGCPKQKTRVQGLDSSATKADRSTRCCDLKKSDHWHSKLIAGLSAKGYQRKGTKVKKIYEEKFEMLDPAASQTELRNQFHIENVLNN